MPRQVNDQKQCSRNAYLRWRLLTHKPKHWQNQPFKNRIKGRAKNVSKGGIAARLRTRHQEGRLNRLGNSPRSLLEEAHQQQIHLCHRRHPPVHHGQAGEGLRDHIVRLAASLRQHLKAAEKDHLRRGCRRPKRKFRRENDEQEDV